LATCIISRRPWLIYNFLEGDIDDDKFNNYVTEIEFPDPSNISLEDATVLLRHKELFFDGGRINLFKHIRSTKPKDRPSNEERNWLINELLSLLAKLALAPDQSRKIPKEARIRDITIRDSPSRPDDRKEASNEVSAGQSSQEAIMNLGDERVCMQSLGYLLFDLIWFFAGGGNCVLALDENRTQGVEWIKKTFWKELNQLPDLYNVFQIVRIMICPDPEFGFSKNDEGRENFRHISKLLHDIWPHITSEQVIDPQKGKETDAASLLGRGLSSRGTSKFEEVDPEIDWM
jgi:hypothetical protein